MHLHVLGVCGTFMGSLAVLAKELGHRVTGSDARVYPPMSTQLAEAGIELMEGFAEANLEAVPDQVVIGNALSRGNPEVEAVLERGFDYLSGPEWLARNVLGERWVLAVAGTHGKTTTSALLAWLLEHAGWQPGFLIGGVPGNFAQSARLGQGPFFVVEADEYDTAFFDKRSKFVHYRPRTLLMNNLEFDHADIFSDLAAIETQFHHLIRTVPGGGRILSRAGEPALERVLSMGCWSEVARFGWDAEAAQWHSAEVSEHAGEFDVCRDGERLGRVLWSMRGRHNVDNALAALAAAEHAGLEPSRALAGLNTFRGVKRRLELLGDIGGVRVYDDFAHHPTAIETTLAGVRAETGAGRLWAVIEPRSNTMRMGHHRERLMGAFRDADEVLWYQCEGLTWEPDPRKAEGAEWRCLHSVDAIVEALRRRTRPGDQVVIMSNGGFEGLHQRLLRALGEEASDGAG